VDQGKDKYLCVYFSADTSISATDLKDFLRKELPEYMLPTYFIQMDQLPHTASGKIDRKNLPKANLELNDTFEAAKGELEQKMVLLWEEILHIHPISVNDSFIKLGGHSLKAMSLILKMNQELQMDIPLQELYRWQTIRAMAQYISANEKQEYFPLIQMEKQKYYPLSSAQKRLFLLNQISLNSTNYNMPAVMSIQGNLDLERIKNIFDEIIARHEVFRTSFHLEKGQPVQKIEAGVEFLVDFISTNENELEQEIQNFIRPFDLAAAPLFRVAVAMLQNGQKYLLIDMHHIISDGLSIQILAQEFIQLYEGKKLNPVAAQYKDYAAWQLQQLSSEKIKQQERFWLDLLSNGNAKPPTLNLPTDYHRPAMQSTEGEYVYVTLNQSLSERLNDLAKQNNTTIYVVLLTIYNVLLYQYTGQEDILVGTPVAGRTHQDTQKMIGMFVNTLVMRNYPKADKFFHDFLLAVKENVIKAFQNQNYQFELLIDKLGSDRNAGRSPLIDTVFTYQDMNLKTIATKELKLTPYRINRSISKFDLLVSAAPVNDGIELEIEYCCRLFKKETIQQFAAHFINAVRCILDYPHIRIGDIEIISPEQRTRLLHTVNDTETNYPKHKSIPELFKEQVDKQPDRIALFARGKKITYQQLDRLANQIAGWLKEKGVKENPIVALMLERSVDMIAAIMGVLKAGGAYLPIDCEYPLARVRTILSDSGAKIVLTNAATASKYSYINEQIITADLNGELLFLEDVPVQKSNDGEISTAFMQADRFAYIMYTSGSSGMPKGNLTTHYNVIRVVKDTNYIQITNQDRILQLSNYAFDGSTFDIFGALLNGAQLVLIDRESILDIDKLASFIIEQKITVFFVTVALFNTLVETAVDCLANVRKIIFGGERASFQHIKKAYSFLGRDRLIHAYGPTESTVFATCYPINKIDEDTRIIPIGTPISNTKVYILDKQLRLLPPLVIGELCISGDGLVKGYLNRRELTEEKFVPHPFIEGEILYRTGDLARWLLDGTIEFIGRIDSQVKIRGFRIELEEIESILLKYEGIQDAVVVPQENENGSKSLCAYFVAKNNLTLLEIRTYLLQHLPGYMIPTYFVQIEEIPLTLNGKIDQKALPDPKTDLLYRDNYLAPMNEIQKILVDVWQEVLGVNQVGIDDHFFELGGDSIKAIQVSAKLSQFHMKIDIKSLFQYPTIQEVSQFIKVESKAVSQSIVVGESRLTPIQKWFFEQNYTDMFHFNQAVIIQGKQGFDETIIRKVMQKIVEHHDVLRMIYTVDGDKVKAFNRGMTEELYTLAVFDIHQFAEYQQLINEKANRLQESINLNSGPLIKLGLFRTVDGDFLLVIVHHLVIDGISWRIFWEDFMQGYQQALNQKKILFPAKTDSYMDWANELELFANSPRMSDSITYWTKVAETDFVCLPKDKPIDCEQNKYRDNSISPRVLSAKETRLLLTKANYAYHTEVNDIILTALGRALTQWSGNDRVLIDLEGHGREEIGSNLDISRTIGWFTSIYPVVLTIESKKGLAFQIKNMKEELRKIPYKGMTYHVLKYLTKQQNNQAKKLKPEISFNYLGQFDLDISLKQFKISKLPVGNTISPKAERTHDLEINCMVVENELNISLNYNANAYEEQTMERLCDSFLTQLQEVVAHCTAQKKSVLTPSDVGDQELTLDEFDEIMESVDPKFEIEKVYPLTPMQEGMLFHALLGTKSNAYFEQMILTVKGDLDEKSLSKSFGYVIQKYGVFRTIFVYEKVNKLRQIVVRQRDPEYVFEDISLLDQDKKIAYIEQRKQADMERGFDVSTDLPIRLMVVKMEQDCYKIIWSFHHIVMDGWCLPIVIKDIFEIYDDIKKKNQINMIQPQPYDQYITWIRKQDYHKASDYWKNYLEGYHQTAYLQVPKKKEDTQYVKEEVQFTIAFDVVSALSDIARKNQATLSSLIQVVWGILLQRYNGVEDVVFGVVVSGRQSKIKGIDTMVGLFINTIPLRIGGNHLTFEELLKETQQAILNAQPFDYFPLYEIQRNTPLNKELLDHIVAFENYPIEEQMQDMGKGQTFYGFELEDIEIYDHSNYDLNVVLIPGDQLKVKLIYNAAQYDANMLLEVEIHIKTILSQIIANPAVNVSDIDIIGEEMQKKIFDQLKVKRYMDDIKEKLKSDNQNIMDANFDF
jgi:amino acid adenylation domain-containing protein/non-ribosomal peptide synthase protein (TIGR01720 family)